jgi:NAD-dependent SIR2 family protein deacetylase
MSATPTRENPEVIILTGAGISIPIGIPAMEGMFKAFMNRAESGISTDEKRACELFTKDLGVAEDLEEFLVAANAITEFGSTSLSPLIERSISSRKDTRNIAEYRQRLHAYAASADNLRRRILQFMSRKCFQFDRDEANALFTRLVTSLAKKGYPVYTTNYDFALEEVAMASGIQINDNFSKKGTRNVWNPSIDFPLGNALTIVKLHGSVTWYVDNRNNIEKIYSNTDINPIGKSVDRIVIAPTRFKDIYAQHFFALYSHFLADLATSRVLVVTGHSLRDDYLRAAIIERVRKKTFSLVIIAPNFPSTLPEELRPAKLGSAGDITHVPYKFEEFADDLASIIRHARPDEIAAQCAEIVHHKRSRRNKISIKGNIGTLKAKSVKSLTAVIDAYIHPNERPASVRVWLEATLKTADGKEQNSVSAAFLESSPILIADGVSGLVQREIPIKFKVPNYTEWVHANKANLRVAVVKRSVQKPTQATETQILAIADRILSYTT